FFHGQPFYYVPKPGKKEKMGNIHPTIKPVSLMRQLVGLLTPPGGICLDPFMGSGTTGVACRMEGVDFVGMEREGKYFEIAKRRIGECLPRSI
ncbi:MAG: site-specific DNA-methyltransferase, partial [Halobacteriovoraceae bacterium]|nr:site-specific DNA-methyltransferase [Halobacteriovoraceae bacterium]